MSQAQGAIAIKRVAIVEDNSEFRESLGTFLAHLPGFACVDAFPAAESALGEARRRLDAGRELGWDLVLMDVELPRMNGIEATRQLRRIAPELGIVILTVFENPGTILQAISEGASGYILKKASARELSAHLRAIAEGGAPLSPAVAATLLEFVRSGQGGERGREASSPDPTRLDLTERETEVLRRLVEGRTYGQTGDDLGISESTVRTHVRAIYRKLQVHSVAAAVRKAIQSGLC